MYSLCKQRGEVEKEKRYCNTEKEELGDVIGVSKLHGKREVRDRSGMMMQPGQSTPRKATERSQSGPCFSGVFLSFRERRKRVA